MGMDLHGCGLSYNLSGWERLISLLEEWGVDTRELVFTNDGDPISRNTCLAIAWAIETHLHELSESEQEWLADHVEEWRSSKGCEQW